MKGKGKAVEETKPIAVEDEEMDDEDDEDEDMDEVEEDDDVFDPNDFQKKTNFV